MAVDLELEREWECRREDGRRPRKTELEGSAISSGDGSVWCFVSRAEHGACWERLIDSERVGVNGLG